MSSPHSPQLEEAQVSSEDPAQTKKKKKNPAQHHLIELSPRMEIISAVFGLTACGYQALEMWQWD